MRLLGLKPVSQTYDITRERLSIVTIFFESRLSKFQNRYLLDPIACSLQPVEYWGARPASCSQDDLNPTL
jgi:hypothetical protein